jgi:hypothetical protein
MMPFEYLNDLGRLMRAGVIHLPDDSSLEEELNALPEDQE